MFLRALPLVALAACAQPGVSPVDADGALLAGAQQAFYDDFPAALFVAHQAACSRPGETPFSPSAAESRCEMLLEPDITAAVILEFGGSVRDLPRIVTSLQAHPSGEGFVVTADNYLRVPTVDGGLRVVRQPDANLDALLQELFVMTGGRPI